MKEAERAVRSGTDGVSGTLRVSAPSDLGRNLLVDILDRFMDPHPEVRMVLTPSDSLPRFLPDDTPVTHPVGPPGKGVLGIRNRRAARLPRRGRTLASRASARRA